MLSGWPRAGGGKGTRALWLALAGLAACALLASPAARAAHGVAHFGEPKYAADFRHFDYVNPDAPKGGTLVLSIVSQHSRFDKLNPFSTRGAAAPGLVELMFETLATLSLDEPNTLYGLLADDIRVSDDFGAAEFHINPLARFSNGDPVTAADVLHSYQVLTQGGSPRFKSYFSEIARVTALDAATVRFEFERKGRDLTFVAASLPVFSPRWTEPVGKPKVPFQELRLQPPIATGPYLIESASERADVVYVKNPSYWGRDIPVRRGTYNFERVVYKLYKDADSQVAAMRSADFDFFSETRMRYWCCQFIGKRFDSGELLKDRLPHRNPPAMNGWVLNLRKERFRDVRVREALGFAFDFEWVNEKILDNEFHPVTSYFTNTSLAATGLPSEEELALLEPHRAELDPRVFGPMVERPTTRPPSSVRQNLRRAIELFAAAGWQLRDGVLRNERGEPFALQVPGARNQTLLGGFYTNLTKIGVVLAQGIADPVTARRKQSEFDFDLAAAALREARMPGAELWRTFNSKDANTPGSENLAGVESPAVDALIQNVLDAKSQRELETAARAVDRVLSHAHYFIPWRYLKQHYVIHNERLRRPATLPLYYGAYDWAIAAWWDGTLEQPAAQAAAAGADSAGNAREQAAPVEWRIGWLLVPVALVLPFALGRRVRTWRQNRLSRSVS